MKKQQEKWVNLRKKFGNVKYDDVHVSNFKKSKISDNYFLEEVVPGKSSDLIKKIYNINKVDERRQSHSFH